MAIETLIKYKNGELKQGIGVDLPSMDRYLVYKPNRFNCIVGRPNIGKTFVMLWYFLLLSKKHGNKWSIYSIENEIWVLKMYLVEFLAGKKTEDIEEAEIYRHDLWINEHFNFMPQETMTLAQVLEEAKKGFYDVFIDPYNALDRPSGNGHDYDYQCIRLIQDYKKKYGSVYINHHPFTEAQRRVIRDKDNEFCGFPDFMRYYDVEGGGKWFNACDQWLSLHRFVSHPQAWMYTRIMVEKEKVVQTGGGVTPENQYILAQFKENRFYVNGVDPLNDKDDWMDNAEEVVF